MITTVTMNLSVDKLYLMDQVEINTVMRVKEVCNTAGGKGLNVSKVAALAGEKVHALGFMGGFNGQYVRSMLEQAGIETNFTPVEGETRSCINIRNLATGKHTEFLEPGSPVTPENLEDFIQRYRQALTTSKVVTISGSVPQGVPTTCYQELIQLAKEQNIPVLLDTSSQLLTAGVKALPTLIKPNTDEIAQLLGRKVTSFEQLVTAAQDLHKSGIAYVVVSLGKEGALMACKEGTFKANTPDIPVVNTVGSGDSMVAGFAVSFARGYQPSQMLQYASAVATANTLTMPTGHIESSDLDWLLQKIKVEALH